MGKTVKVVGLFPIGPDRLVKKATPLWDGWRVIGDRFLEDWRLLPSEQLTLARFLMIFQLKENLIHWETGKPRYFFQRVALLQ